MPVAPLKKVRLFFPLTETSHVLDVLQDFGSTHIIEHGEENPRYEKQVRKREYQLNTVEHILKFLKPYYDETISWKDSVIPKDPVVLTPQKTEEILDADFETAVNDIVAQERELISLQKREAALTDKIAAVADWESLPFLPGITKEEYVHITVGSVSEKIFSILKRVLETETDLVEVRTMNTVDGVSYFYVLFYHSVSETVSRILHEYDADPFSLETDGKLPKDILTSLRAQHADVKRDISIVLEQVRKYAPMYPKLTLLADALRWDHEKWEKTLHVFEHRYTGYIDMWVPADRLRLLERMLKIEKANLVYDDLEFDGIENPPVLLRNKLGSSMEFVTNMYGLPGYSEPDPTPFLAPFFILFFGFCVIDAGYGLLFILISLIVKSVFTLGKTAKQLMNILLFGGVAAFMLGVLFGGWFGYSPVDMPGQIGAFLQSVRMFDPVANPITILYITFILGIAQIMVGIGVALWWSIRSGQWLEGLADHGTWILFLASIVLFVLDATHVVSIPAQFVTWFVWGSIVLLIIGQGRKSKNVFMKFLSGVLSLTGLIGYFSDMLSYSRLLALGLAGSIIASVVNLLAGLAYDGVSGVFGWFVAGLVLIIGHGFNMILTLMGAYIHSARLQYVEFFPKFMEGGGKPFKPFVRTGKYSTYSVHAESSA